MMPSIENLDSASALEPMSAIIGEDVIAQKPMLDGDEKEVEVYEEEKSKRRFWCKVIIAVVLLAALIGGISGGVSR